MNLLGFYSNCWRMSLSLAIRNRLSSLNWITILSPYINHFMVVMMDIITEILDFFNLHFLDIWKLDWFPNKTLLHYISIFLFDKAGKNISFLANSLEWLINTFWILLCIIFPIFNLQFSVKFLFLFIYTLHLFLLIFYYFIQTVYFYL